MRILRAPGAVEEPAIDQSHSPSSITSAWVKDTRAKFNPAPPAPAPTAPEPAAPTTKEADGKADTTERRVPEQPAKPAVGSDPGTAAPAKETKPDAAPSPETKPEAAKADAAEDWETTPAPKGIPPKDFEAWKKGRKESETKLKAEIKAREDKLAEFEAQLNELKTKAVAPGEIPADIKSKLEWYEKENKELTDKITVLDVTQHPRFVSYYSRLADDAISLAKEAVGPERAEQAERLMKLPDSEWKKSQVEEFMLGLDETAKIDLRHAMIELRKVTKDREAEIKKASDHREQIAAENKARSDREQQEKITTFNKISQELADPEKGFLPYQKQANNPEWNASVDKRIALVKSILTGEGRDADGNPIKPETILRGAFDAAAMPVVLQSYKAAMDQWNKEKAELEQKIQTLTAAQPAPGGGTVESEDPNKMNLTSNMDPQAVTREFARRTAQMARGG